MQQRQLRLGDILDDYCPRERRVTNHAVVALVADTVKQTRCTTCDTEHEYKHGKVPRQRRKAETPAALYAQVLTGGPKRVSHEAADEDAAAPAAPLPGARAAAAQAAPADDGGRARRAPAVDRMEARVAAPDVNAGMAAKANDAAANGRGTDSAADGSTDGGTDDATTEGTNGAQERVADGPAHRRLIRATLPRLEGQPPPARPAPEFTIRQPAGRQNRFRPRQQRGPSPFHDSRSGNSGNSAPRQNGGRPPMAARAGKRYDAGGRKRSK